MSYRAWFQCINPVCGQTYPLNSIVYQCKRCHSLLEVQHDLQALKRRSAASWKKLFEERYMSNEWPYGSGVWGKKEWILPQIDDNNIVVCNPRQNPFLLAPHAGAVRPFVAHVAVFEGLFPRGGAAAFQGLEIVLHLEQ